MHVKNIKKMQCNPIVRFSKFASNKEIYEEFERFLSKLVWRETLSWYFRVRLMSTLKAFINSSFRKLTKFFFKLGCKLRLQLPLKKINMTIYFEYLTID